MLGPDFDDSLVEYDIDVYQDDTPVRGNAMCSGDDDFDREVEDAIITRLNDGDVWAWAAVRVTARYPGVPQVVGADHLGCCTYANEEDFKGCDYYADMKDQAREDLYAQIEGILYRFGCIDPEQMKGV
jgi:hypothetical protein